MPLKLKPIVQKIINILKKDGFQIMRIRGDHIIINKEPPLKRPIVLVNEKKLSNVVRLNLIKECKEAGINTQKIDELF